jgi:hypothetical protein
MIPSIERPSIVIVRLKECPTPRPVKARVWAPTRLARGNPTRAASEIDRSLTNGTHCHGMPVAADISSEGF